MLLQQPNCGWHNHSEWFLVLKSGDNIYKLLVVESSIVCDDVTDKWIAEFSLRDLTTGQSLAPEGTFEVGCLG